MQYLTTYSTVLYHELTNFWHQAMFLVVSQSSVGVHHYKPLYLSQIFIVIDFMIVRS